MQANAQATHRYNSRANLCMCFPVCTHAAGVTECVNYAVFSVTIDYV